MVSGVAGAFQLMPAVVLGHATGFLIPSGGPLVGATDPSSGRWRFFVVGLARILVIIGLQNEGTVCWPV